MEYFSITINPSQFKKQYIIYIIELFNDNKAYYYIGQTGDKHYKTARPAFRRLGGHFSDQGYSTENQVYRGIATKILGLEKAKKRKTFNDQIKNRVSDFLETSKIKMHVFPIKKFNFQDSNLIHTEKRIFVENIERYLILKFNEIFGNNFMLNKTLYAIKGNEETITKIKLKGEELYSKFKDETLMNNLE